MELTVIQPDLAGGTEQLHDIIWKRASGPANRAMLFLFFAGVFCWTLGFLHNRQFYIALNGTHVYVNSWGFPENAGCVLAGIAAFYFMNRIAQKRKYKARIKQLTDRMRMGLNECSFTFTNSEMRYSSYDYHVELKWSTFRSYYIAKTWIVLESDYSMFGVDTRLITEDQKQELIAFLNGTIHNQWAQNTNTA